MPAPVFLSSFLAFFSVVAVVYLDRRAGDILHRYSLPRVLRKAGLFVRNLEIPDEAVVDHHALGVVLAHALGLVHLDPVDQLGQKILRPQSGDGSLIDIYFGSIGKSIREPSPD